MVQHLGLANLTQREQKFRCASRQPRILQFASFSFDACIFEIALAYSFEVLSLYSFTRTMRNVG